MTDENNLPADIVFKFSDDEQQLIAVVPAGDNVLPTSTMMLNSRCEVQGCGDWQIEEAALAEVVSLNGTLEQEREFVVALRKDGEVAIEVLDHAMRAVLSITPPRGGKPISEAQVMEALASAGVTHGINNAAIKSAVGTASVKQAVIAEATLPVKGEDAVFENLIPVAKDHHPKINDDGRVDYHETSHFVVVDAGDHLMRRHPPTKGTDGIDVYGEPIPAKPGKNLEFASGLSGVEIDSAENNLLKATSGGQPKVVQRGVSVSSVLTVKNVDISTGNIDFVGTTNIMGDVVEGMKVSSTGDIMVSGVVEGAVLNAGGNIVIKKGVIGRGELHTEKGESGHGVAHLKSGGSIEARFIENAIVEAAENVTVGELVSHSEVSAHNYVLVGKKGARKGHILGGKTTATTSVQAQVIGSQSDVKTIIEVGNAPEFHERIRKLQSELQSKEEEKEKLLTLISRLKLKVDKESKILLKRVIATYEELNVSAQDLTDEIEPLRTQDELTATATVKVGKHAFSGVEIIICDKELKVMDRTEAGEFLLAGDKVKFEHR